MSLPAHPSAADCSASLTAVAMGELTAAVDMLVSCYRPTTAPAETVHERRSNGSCRCGTYRAGKSVRRTV